MKQAPDTEKLDKLKQSLAELMASTKELAHGQETLTWLLHIQPGYCWQLQIAAFAHDIERAVPYKDGSYPPLLDPKDHATYDAYKQAHALRSARIVQKIIRDQGFAAQDTNRVYSAIKNHEVGGDSDSDLVRDADSIRWFDSGYKNYIARYCLDGAKEKGLWMYKRASEPTKALILSLEFDDAIKQYVLESESTGL